MPLEPVTLQEINIEMMENKFTIKETLLLFGGVGFMLIWVGEVIQGVDMKLNYFWGMLAFACFFGFQYTKNNRLEKEKTAKKENPAPKSIKKKR